VGSPHADELRLTADAERPDPKFEPLTIDFDVEISFETPSVCNNDRGRELLFS
jgi:hypothetical protein